ncbi:VWA domain-containing protein, partial [Planctomycetota bacterium]
NGFNYFSLAALIPIVIVCLTVTVREHKKRDIFLTGLISLSLFFAASGLITTGNSKGTCYLFLLDYSGSALPYTKEIQTAFSRELASIEKKGSDASLAALIVFGRDVEAPVLPCSLNTFRKKVSAASRHQVSGQGTDLAKAVETALASVPEDYTPELIIIGDATHQGSTIRIPSGLKYTYSAVKKQRSDAALIKLRCPSSVQAGEKFVAALEVYASKSSPGILRIYNSATGIILTTMPGSLTPGINRFELPLVFEQPGLHVIMGEVGTEKDMYPDNNVLKQTITVTKDLSPSILVVGKPIKGLTDKADHVLPALFRKMVSAKLNSYSGIVINDIPYKDIGPEKDRDLRKYVTESGGGLMLTGTNYVFGPGEYGYTSLEEILPLSSKPRTPDKSPKRIMIAVDKSGSMNEPLGSEGGRKLDTAKAAALQFILEYENDEHTKIGLLFFSAEVEVVKKPSEISPYNLLKNKLTKLTPFGGTKIIPALETCMDIFDAEAASNDEDVYIFIFTDGITREEIPDKDIDAIAESLMKKKVVLFTLKIGAKKAGILKTISEKSEKDKRKKDKRNKYKEITEQENVVIEFKRGTEIVTSKELYVKEPCKGVYTPGSHIAGLTDAGNVFDCTGYIKTSLQKNSIQIAKNMDNDDPFAAVRYAGLGRTAAMAGVKSGEMAKISGRMLSWIQGDLGSSLYSIEIKKKSDGFGIGLVTKNVIPAGTAAAVRIFTPDGKASDVRIVREEPFEFRGVYNPGTVPEWFAYTVSLNSNPVMSGRYYIPYSNEYHPLYERPVMFSDSGIPLSIHGRTRSYAPFVIGFLLVFMVYEAVKGIQRARQGRGTGMPGNPKS